MSTRSHAPLFATINVTTACNLDCKYCFMQPRSNQYMTSADFRRAVAELAAAQVFFVNISGGEPFVHPEIGDFLHIAHRTFKHVMVLSNGTAMRRSHFAMIERILREKNAFTVQVSLDAVDSRTNAETRAGSHRIVRTIRHLADMGVNVIVAMVVTRCNVESLLQSIDVLSSCTRYFHLMTVQDVRQKQGIEEQLRLDRSTERRLWETVGAFARERDLAINTPLNYEGRPGCATGAPCMAAFSHVVIDPDLRIRPCDRLTDVYLGDIRHHSISEVWNSPSVEPILNSPVPYCRLDRAMPGGQCH